MFGQIKLIVDGFLIPIISVAGLFGNIFSIIVLRSHGLDMKVKLTQFGLIDFSKFSGYFSRDPHHAGPV